MDLTKAAGWLLLAAGVITIAWAVFWSFNIFTGKEAPAEIFKIPAAEKAAVQGKGGLDIQSQLQQMMGDQLKGFLPSDTMPKILNLTAFSMLAFILIFAGAQLSGLGIKLLRKEKQ